MKINLKMKNIGIDCYLIFYEANEIVPGFYLALPEAHLYPCEISRIGF